MSMIDDTVLDQTDFETKTIRFDIQYLYYIFSRCWHGTIVQYGTNTTQKRSVTCNMILFAISWAVSGLFKTSGSR